MARSKIRSEGVQLNSDTGAVLFSLIEGEQQTYKVTLSWLTNADGYILEAVLMEAQNTGNGKPPKLPMLSGINTELIITQDAGTNVIYLQFPATLIATWSVRPLPDKPVYGFFDLRVTEPSGAFPTTWKPLQGLVEIGFSPTQLVS